MLTNNSAPVALITGTSTGIGLSAAIQCAQANYVVVATMRDLTKAAALQEAGRAANVQIDIRQCDVSDDASVNACVTGVLEQYGKIDLLINNAGAGFLGTMEMTSNADLIRTMETNFFGVWRMTNAVFPAMRTAGKGRILTVTSIGGLFGQPFNDAYCAAKFAVEGFMESLAPVARRLGIIVALIEPGPVNTNFVASVQAQLPVITPEMQAVYGPMIQSYLRTTQERFASSGQTPDEVAQVILEAAKVESPHLRYPTAPAVQQLVAQKYVDPSGDQMMHFFAQRMP